MKVKARLASGFLELSPNKQKLFDNCVDGLKSLFEKYSFLSIDTPVMELSEILLAKAGGELDKEVYTIKKGDTEFCLRYDLTVPFARYCAMNYNDLVFPFRRYQIAKSYRGERPQKGRFREFYQCDADIVYNAEFGVSVDAECIGLMVDAYKTLNVEPEIHISNRKVLLGFLRELNLQEKEKEILTLVDKLGKIGKEAFFELMEPIQPAAASGIYEISSLKGSFQDILPALRGFSKNEIYLRGVQELDDLYKHLSALKVDDENLILDLSVIRGQDYYTGVVFEGQVKSKPNYGVVGGGGRYDNLCEHFSNEKLCGVGMSIGLSRLFQALDEDGHFKDNEDKREVVVIPLDINAFEAALNLVQELRKNNIKAIWLDEEKQFKNKLKDAAKRECSHVVIIGEEEVKENLFTLKDMRTGEQIKVNKEKLIKSLK